MLRRLARLADRARGEHASPAARACLLTLLIGAAAIVLHAFARWWGGTIWDDAFIFQRYATNLAAGDGIAFNPDGAPTYGLTALLYLLPVAAVRLGLDDPAVAALATSSVCAAIAFGLLARLAYKAAGGGTAGWLAVAATAVVAAAPTSAEHVVSGMDTWFGVAYLAGLLWSLHHLEARPATWGRVGVLSGVALWVRPELVAFGALTALAIVLWPTRGCRRRVGLMLGVTTVFTVAALMLGAWAYFDVPLPLPFFTKASGIYGEGFMRVYRGRGFSELGVFLAQVWPLLLPLGFELGTTPRRWWRGACASERGVAAAAVVLVVFHVAVAVPVMGMHARFFQPVLPALVYLSARSLARLRVRAQEQPISTWPAAVLAANALLWTQLFPVASEAVEAAGARMAHSTHVSTSRLAMEQHPRSYWPGLNDLSELPPLTIAATEVGLIGVVAPQHRIIDIAGLNTKTFAFGPFDVDHLVDEATPDLVYMPHPDYRDMIDAIESHAAFRDRYLILGRHLVGGSHYGVAVREDSPHADAVTAIVRRGGRLWAAKRASR